MDRLDKAEKYLNKALRIRSHSRPKADLAVTRDNLGRLHEMRGDLQAAQDIRLQGASDNNIACGNYAVGTLTYTHRTILNVALMDAVREPLQQTKRPITVRRLQGEHTGSGCDMVPESLNQHRDCRPSTTVRRGARSVPARMHRISSGLHCVDVHGRRRIGNGTRSSAAVLTA